MKTDIVRKQLLPELIDLVGRISDFDSSLFGVIYEAPTQFEASVYNPVFCLILQGSKETNIGVRSIEISQGQALVVSHDLPITSRIKNASLLSPYMALILPIDMDIIRGLNAEMSELNSPQTTKCNSLEVCTAGVQLIDAMRRYLEIGEIIEDTAILKPMVLKEIHYHLFMAPSGAMLHQLLHRDSHAKRIANVISFIRQNYKNTLSVTEMARIACMSKSAFYKRFKMIIGTTPLQYQKDLRLIEAQRLLTHGQCSVSSTAYEVGYESPAQFSREYSRKFNCSPVQHLVR